MKLTRSKLTSTLKKLVDGKTVYQARKVAKISVRRVYQVKEAFDTTRFLFAQTPYFSPRESKQNLGGAQELEHAPEFIPRVLDKTGEIPDIGKHAGSPRKPFEKWEILIMKKAYEKYRVSADTLERLIERNYQRHIGHNRIHQILVYLGYAQKKKNRDIRKKKWKRYERRHSLTAVHID